jgi:hypothetical protein
MKQCFGYLLAVAYEAGLDTFVIACVYRYSDWTRCSAIQGLNPEKNSRFFFYRFSSGLFSGGKAVVV